MEVDLCRRLAATVISIAIFSIAGCAYSPWAKRQNDAQNATENAAESTILRGRLSLRVLSDASVTVGEAGAKPLAQSFSASFELSGNAQTGELLLFSPLGTTVAALNWSAQTASMRTNGETRVFSSLPDMLRQATGTDIPVASLFAWLAGDNTATPGWQADLTQHTLGRVVARRNEPLPQVELRLIMEK